MPLPLAYLALLRNHSRLLGFGFLAAFTSSFGQTYFIGAFGPAIQTEFALSHTAWGLVYMTGTIASALLLPWTGREIDRMDLRHYTLAAGLVMLLACLVTGLAQGVVMLTLAVFLLRHSGQGLMSHICRVSMARYFDRDRGRAIAVGTMGFATGEALLPLLAVTLIATFGWRTGYLLVTVALGLVLIPALQWLLRGHAERHRVHLDGLRAAADGADPAPSRTLREVLHDPRFHLLLPGIVTPSLVITAMFFHHLNLADAKGWSHAWITGNYVVYAASTVATTLFTGSLIDRGGSLRLVPSMLIPLIAAMVVVALFRSPWAVPPYLLLSGMCVGVAHIAVTAMWAELYGLRSLGAIKSFTTALTVLSSALGPVLAGVLMDRGLSIEQVCLLFGGYAAAASVLMAAAVFLPARAWGS